MTWTYEATGRGQRRRRWSSSCPAMTRSRSPLASGAGRRRRRCRRRPPSPGHFNVAWDSYIATGSGSCTRVLGRPTMSPRTLEDLYLTSAAVLRTHQDRTCPAPRWRVCRSRGAMPATTLAATTSSGPATWSIGGRSRRSRGAWVGRRALAYLVATQEPDGHWVQNQWVDGVGYWDGVQLDEAAYPILLAGALRRTGATPYARPPGEAALFEHLITEEAATRMIWTAARFIARTGPATGQDRWEENEGLTPSTLAPVVAALVVAADHLPRAGGRLLPRARRRLERLYRGLDVRDRHASRARVRRRRPLRPHRFVGRPRRGPDLDASADPKQAAGRVQRARPTRWSGTDFLALVRFGLRTRGRPVHPLNARRCRRPPADRDAGRPCLAPIQRRWLRRAPRRQPVRRNGLGRGWPLWSGSAATTSSRRAGTPGRTSRRWPPSPRRAGCSPSRSGTQPTSLNAAYPSAVRAARRCRSPGLTRST